MMSVERPDVSPTGRYSVEQTRELLGIARSTLYKWEARGYIKSHIHRHTMKRFFWGLDILRCWNATI